MLATAPRLTAYDNRPSLRTRLAALLLSLALVALILATLIAMGMLDTLPGGPGERLTAVTMSSRNQEQQKQQQAKTNNSAAPQLNQPVLSDLTILLAAVVVLMLAVIPARGQAVDP